MSVVSVGYRSLRLYSIVQHSDEPSVMPDDRSLDYQQVPTASSQNICGFHNATTHKSASNSTVSPVSVR